MDEKDRSMPQSIILALDTSTQACSVAINNAQGKVFHKDVMTPQSHANQILDMIQTLMSDAEVKPNELDILAYGQGPGAFTGIRIAAGVIQGLALGWDKPVIGLSSLSSIAKSIIQLNIQKFQNYERVEWISLVDARMKEVYWQAGIHLKNDWQESEIEMLPAGEFLRRLEAKVKAFHQNSLTTSTDKKALVICGDIEREYPQAIEMLAAYTGQNSDISWFPSLPSAQAMLELARLKQGEVQTTCEALPTPLYLRNHVADTIAEREAKKLAKSNLS